MHFIVVQAPTTFHQVVGLGDQLHDAVFDAVVDHLHEVPGRSRPQPGHARIAVDLRRSRFKDGTDALVGLFRPAGHDARPVTRAFFATRHAHAEKLDAFRRQVAGAHVRVFEIGVAGINDEIALVQVRQQILDDRIHRSAGGHQHHDRARSAEQGDELMDVRRAAMSRSADSFRRASTLVRSLS